MKFKKSVKTFILFLAMIVLVLNSPAVLSSVKNGLTICFSSVIPALFPFMVLSSAFVGSLKNNSFKLLSYITGRLFGFSSYGTGAFICGMICGYPIGAKCASELFKEGKISSSEAETLIACSNNSGPLFIIGAVGTGMLGSYRAGVLLYLIHISCAVIAAMVLKPYTYTKHIMSASSHKAKNLTHCICENVTNMLNICGFIVFFSVVNKLLEPVISFLPAFLQAICLIIIEITNGIYFIAKSGGFITDKIILIAIALGWSGLSVHMQVKNIIAETGLSMKKYYTARIGIALLSAIAASVWAGKTDNILSVVSVDMLRIIFATVSVTGIAAILFIKKRQKKKDCKNIQSLNL